MPLKIAKTTLKKHNNYNIMEQFIKQVANLRRLQKEYFKSRDYLILKKCKDAEKEVDAFLERHTPKEQTPRLF